MPLGSYKVRAPGTLKAAENLLVYMCGGAPTAAKLLDGRVGPAQLQRYTDDSGEAAQVNMPVDIVLKLEAACENAVVTRYLAFAAHALLVPLPGGPDEPYLQHLCDIGQEVGEFFQTATGALADGVMTPKEAGDIKNKVMKLATELGVLLARLDRVIESGVADR